MSEPVVEPDPVVNDSAEARATLGAASERLLWEYEQIEALGVAASLSDLMLRELLSNAVTRASSAEAAVPTTVPATAVTVVAIGQAPLPTAGNSAEGAIPVVEAELVEPPPVPPPEEDVPVVTRAQPPPFDELRVFGLMGCGGFGFVELVGMPHQTKSFARKCCSKAYANKSSTQTCLRRERVVLALAYSPFIVSFHGTYNTPRAVYFLTEAALGGELYQIYASDKVRHGNQEAARYYSASVFLALQHLHGKSIVCRGVKPEDCVLDSQGRLKLCDMGLAKPIIEKTFTACGTPDYFAPEIVASSGHSFPVDFWALGAMIYEMLAGEPPFEAASPFQVYSKIMKGIAGVKFRERTRPAQELVMMLLSRKPCKRVPDPGAVMHNFWYRDFDWEGLANERLAAPYMPIVRNHKDLGNFRAHEADKIPVSDYVDDGSGWDQVFG